ncbi:consortin [Polymixia lowei]
MDYGGQCEREEPVVSQVQGGGVDFCDNLPESDAFSAQNRNLNETHTLSQTRTLAQAPSSSSRNERREGRELIQKDSPNDNGREEVGKEGHRVRMGEVDEEEENDEMMKEEEEEEQSEGSSSLIRCQSPDTPMTDSSYSETGSLLETPYAFSPGTSPEPTSPIIPVASPGTTFPISPLEWTQRDPEVNAHISNTGSGASTTEPINYTTGSTCATGPITCTIGPTCITGPIDCSKLTTTSAAGPTSAARPTCATEATPTVARTIDSTTGPVTSSTQPSFTHRPTCMTGPVSSYAEPITSTSGSGTSTTAVCTTGLTTAIVGSVSSTINPITSTTGPITTGPTTSTCGSISLPVPTCTTGPSPGPALLASLEQLGQRGDDAHLPQHLHQIAEAFVLQEDYQRALCCIQLERLYHQRILDNLNTLQEQWESHCRRLSVSDPSTQLDTLTHICQTHSRPSARDAKCASLDFLKPSMFEEERLCGPLSSCTSGHWAEGGMEKEQTDTDSSLSRNSQPIASSAVLTGSSTEKSEKGGTETDRELEGRVRFYGNQIADREEGKRQGGVAESGMGYTTSVGRIGKHPPTGGEMEQSVAAAGKGGEIEPAQEKEETEVEQEGREDSEVKEAGEALEMEDEGEEEEEKEEGRHPSGCLKALPEEILIPHSEVVVQQLHQEARDEEELHEETQVREETPLCQEADMKQQEQWEEEGEEEYEEYEEYEMEEECGVQRVDIIREAASLDDMAKLITVEEVAPPLGLVSILKKRTVRVDNVCESAASEAQPSQPQAKRRVRFKVPDDGYDHDVGSGDSCLLLFLLCLVTVVISVGGTALYCALGDAHSTVCQDFSRNADFYIAQMQRGIAQIQHWFTPGS